MKMNVIKEPKNSSLMLDSFFSNDVVNIYDLYECKETCEGI